ncbi:hypothetical protein RE428_27030 [Marinobacter nanhaiticus D15-8W]|nr:hypothetical protein RE428_27030 [Marinobacter nanhaiticus D15-8W]
MSLAILEYMRASLPVVASDNPSVSSALKHREYAMIYPAEDIERAASTIKHLVENSAMREQLGRTAHRKVVENFSSEVMLSKFRDTISTIVD